MASKKRTAKQKEFDLLLKYADNVYELTKRIRTDDIELVRKYKDKLLWSNIVQRKTLTNDFIDEFWDEMSPKVPKIEVHPNMHIDFLDRNRDYINWQRFVWSSSGARFDIDFVNKFREELEPYHNSIVTLKNLPQETREYLLNDKDNYKSLIHSLSHNRDIDKATLEKYKDDLDWNELSKRATILSNTSVFETYKKYINLYVFTSLSEIYFPSAPFIISRIKLVVNEEFLLKYKDCINWFDIINYHGHDLKRCKDLELPLDFFIKHKDELPKHVNNMFNEWVRHYLKYLPYKDYNARRNINLNYNDPYFYLVNNNHIYWKFAEE